MVSELATLLQQSSARHNHLCPRQVLGVRMGLAGFAALGLEAPLRKKEVLTIIETDGCFADGVEVATGATVGHRTLRVVDLGKIAATFAEVATGRAIRLAPKADVRQCALEFAPGEKRRYYAQLKGYQVMPDVELFNFQPVSLQPSIEEIISKQQARARCERCGEEIINEREVRPDGQVLCRSCAGEGYYYKL